MKAGHAPADHEYLTLALDAFRFSFGSAGALELLNEYSGLATEAAPILPSQSSGMHVPCR
ncbi:protein of unknown function [uncultured Woeseiaceae bacterium]|uniref:Uncharacterized protein n=1 Tax=uncultured Woeseiaceae bacterium TaxID=1983305 RepID=A0A7D9D233_9GAMM|nr:protein of unknown function [uncultured Woeseiaceae bacterium]